MLLQTRLMPETFQGKQARPPYFEGWYFRLQNGTHSISLIPGICLEPKPHAYLQYLNAEIGQSFFWEYPISDFRFDSDRFEIFVGKNIFSADYVQLDTPLLHGKIYFKDRVPFAPGRLNTGMMGPFAFFPQMQCAHGVVTIRSGLEGSITDGNRAFSFTGGTGYVEKDWGTAFPNPYLWTQAHFADSTFMLCLARVPVPGGKITGILAFLYAKGKRHLFATYMGARLVSICHTDDGDIHLTIRAPLRRLSVRLSTGEGLPLKAPGSHGMDREIRENPKTVLTVRLTDCRGGTVFQGRTDDAAAEIVGNIFSL